MQVGRSRSGLRENPLHIQCAAALSRYPPPPVAVTDPQSTAQRVRFYGPFFCALTFFPAILRDLRDFSRIALAVHGRWKSEKRFELKFSHLTLRGMTHARIQTG